MLLVMFLVWGREREEKSRARRKEVGGGRWDVGGRSIYLSFKRWSSLSTKSCTCNL
jgi:hypothetical protein